MPTYQYACTDCGHDFEQVQSFSDDALSVCPQCQGKLRKVYNAVGVVFKGSGFYRNDSRSNATANASGSDSGTSDSGSADSGSSDKTSETKTEAGSGSKSDTKVASTESKAKTGAKPSAPAPSSSSSS